MSASLMHIWHTSNLSFSLDQSIPVDGSSPTWGINKQTRCRLAYSNVPADAECYMQIEYLYSCLEDWLIREKTVDV